MMTPALLNAALLLLLLPGAPAQDPHLTNISILVANSVTNATNLTYTTHVLFRGILLGGMRRLQDTQTGFTFTYTEDPNYGPFLQSVNGLSGCLTDRTYWELLVKKPNNQTVRPDVGIGCYIPSAGDVVILNFNKYRNKGSKPLESNTEIKH